MARHDRTLPYFLGRFNYWTMDIAFPSPAPPAWRAQPPALAQEARDHTLENVLAILKGQDLPDYPTYQPDLHVGLASLGLDSEPDSNVRALRYWIALDQLWYQSPLARDVRRSLPARHQEALDKFGKQLWAPRKKLWTWVTLPQRIAQDQHVFKQILELGATKAGVVHDSPGSIAQSLFGINKSTARKIYTEYSRQASVLLGLGAKPRRDWATWLRDAGALNRQSRMQVAPLLADVEEAYHWFAHALRNLVRYRNNHPPLPWPADQSSCARHCRRELEKLAT